MNDIPPRRLYKIRCLVLRVSRAFQWQSSAPNSSIISMATSITRLVASRVFRNHRVLKGVLVTIVLLRVAKRLSLCQYKKEKKYYSDNLRFDVRKL